MTSVFSCFRSLWIAEDILKIILMAEIIHGWIQSLIVFINEEKAEVPSKLFFYSTGMDKRQILDLWWVGLKSGLLGSLPLTSKIPQTRLFFRSLLRYSVGLSQMSASSKLLYWLISMLCVMLSSFFFPSSSSLVTLASLNGWSIYYYFFTSLLPIFSSAVL